MSFQESQRRQKQELSSFGTREILNDLTQGKGFKVFDSEANFLLFKWKDQEVFKKAYQQLLESGVQARDVSSGPALAGCMRLTIGSKKENDFVLKVFKEHL